MKKSCVPFVFPERIISSSDAPDIGKIKRVHPTTVNTWSTTEGGVNFKEHIVGYSNSFTRNYYSLAMFEWQVTYKGEIQADGSWKDNGSTVTGAHFMTMTYSPGESAAIALQALGFSFVNEFGYIYKIP